MKAAAAAESTYGGDSRWLIPAHRAASGPLLLAVAGATSQHCCDTLQVFGIPIGGTIVPEAWAIDGSGSTYIWRYMDSAWR